MVVVITEWALQSYLNLYGKRVFTDQEYWNRLRPDVELLRDIGTPAESPSFGNAKFWSPATVRGVVVRGGFKMKWHNVGSGQVQLRLGVAIYGQEAFLCEGYVKGGSQDDDTKMAGLKNKLWMISKGNVTRRGVI